MNPHNNHAAEIRMPRPIGEYRLGGTPRATLSGEQSKPRSMHWIGGGLVVVIAGIGGVVAYLKLSEPQVDHVAMASAAMPSAITPPPAAVQTVPADMLPPTAATPATATAEIAGAKPEPATKPDGLPPRPAPTASQRTKPTESPKPSNAPPAKDEQPATVPEPPPTEESKPTAQAETKPAATPEAPPAPPAAEDKPAGA